MTFSSMLWDYSWRDTAPVVWPNAVQPEKKIPHDFYGVPFLSLHHSTQKCPSLFHIWVILALEVLPLERDGVVEEELRSTFEHIWEVILGDVQEEGT